MKLYKLEIEKSLFADSHFICHTLVLGYLSYTFFERHVLSLKKKLCRPA